MIMAGMATRGTSRLGETSQAASVSRLPISVITLIVSTGVFFSSAAYTAGRMGYADSAWPNRVYWFGQALVLIPIAGRLFSRRPLTRTATVTLVVVLTVAEYLLKVCYSPLGFTFTDELLHWRATTNLLQTGDPFTVNYGLQIGPHYPGLELVASAFISSTGLPIFTAGLIIAGLAHLAYICLIYSAFSAFTRSHRIAGIAIFLYFGTPDLTSFNSMFVYETLAVVFLALVVLAAVRAATEKSQGERRRWFVLAVLGILATVVTHHVTSYMLTIFLISVTLTSAATGYRRTAVKLGALAIISTTAVACWVIFVAPDTISYFRPTAQGLVQGLNALLSDGSSGARATTLAPRGDQLLEGLGILLILALLLFGCWQVWRRDRYHPWILAIAIASLAWFIALGLRLGTPDGQELAGRTAVFVLIPVSLTAALALTKFAKVFASRASLRRWRSAAMAVAVAGVLTLLFDGLANGWPPYWERLPGPHQVAGFESSVGPEEVATADWALSALGPGNRFAADSGIYPALAGYGDQNALQDVAYLFMSPKFTLAIARSAHAQDVQYVLVDQRLSESLPASGTYFPGDTLISTRPIPLANLTKFNNLPDVARLYDDGNIVIYNLQSSQYGP